MGLVADDLTGACDSSSPFLRCGRVRVYIWPRLPDEAAGAGCLAVCTESRDESPEVSGERSAEATRRLRELGASQLYRKVDSAFRGNEAADLRGTLAAWPGTCVLAPALPEEGRTTVDGVQRWPGGEADLRALKAEVGDRLQVRDAATRADLRRIAEEVCPDPGLFPAGSAGLALEVARVLSGRQESIEAEWPRPSRPLALIGSSSARPQAELAAERGWDVRFRARGDAVDLDGFDGLLLSGGGTAAGVLGRLGADSLELLGEAAPRMPVGIVSGGAHDGLPVVLKSGHFGPPDAIDQALRRFSGRG